MTTYYVSVAGDDSDGTTWAKAWRTLQPSLEGATSPGVTDVYVDKDHTEDSPIAADQTAGAGQDTQIYCVDKDNSNALAVMDGSTGYLGDSSTNFSYTLNGAFKVYYYGIAVLVAGSTADSITLASSDGSDFVFENCKFWLKNSASTARINVGSTSNSRVRFINCDFWFGHADQGFVVRCTADFIGCTLNSGGTDPTSLFLASTNSGATILCQGCDWSATGGNLMASQATIKSTLTLVNCKLGSGFTALASQTPANLSSGEVLILNSSSADQHYHLAHYNALGSTVISTDIYVTADGASYDGTNKHSWYVSGTANANWSNPYISPWIDCYHSGTSAITPYLEICRSGSATAYQNDEVWSEWSYQGTSGFPLATIVNDRMAPLGTAADQTSSSLSGSDWTGENATSWFGKLAPTASITPAEIGHLRARILVGGEYAIYADPQIRGRS